MSVLKSVRLGIAGSLVVALPVQSVTAAVRPSAAIPSAATASAASAQGEFVAVGASFAWPAFGIILATIITAIAIERHKGRGRGNGFSR